MNVFGSQPKISKIEFLCTFWAPNRKFSKIDFLCTFWAPKSKTFKVLKLKGQTDSLIKMCAICQVLLTFPFLTWNNLDLGAIKMQ